MLPYANDNKGYYDIQGNPCPSISNKPTNHTRSALKSLKSLFFMHVFFSETNFPAFPLYQEL